MPSDPPSAEVRPNATRSDAQPAVADEAPSSPRARERSKILSVRLTADEFQRLDEQAEVLGVGPSTLARTFIRQALADASAPMVRSRPAGGEASLLEAHLAELIARVETLERWAAEQQ
jgi:hypothetical protein